MQLGAEAKMRLRDMTAADLPGAHALSRQARWPHRLEDWELMLQCGQGVVVEDDGQIVGTVMGFPHGPEIATLGMVIVSQEHRGAGIGRKLMDAMMEQLAPRAIQLNATPDGTALYRGYSRRWGPFTSTRARRSPRPCRNCASTSACGRSTEGRVSPTSIAGRPAFSGGRC